MGHKTKMDYREMLFHEPFFGHAATHTILTHNGDRRPDTIAANIHIYTMLGYIYIKYI